MPCYELLMPTPCRPSWSDFIEAAFFHISSDLVQSSAVHISVIDADRKRDRLLLNNLEPIQVIAANWKAFFALKSLKPLRISRTTTFGCLDCRRLLFINMLW